MQDIQKQAAGISRRSALKLGLGSMVAVAALGAGSRIVMAQEGQILKDISPAFSQDWSPLRGGGVPYPLEFVLECQRDVFRRQGRDPALRPDRMDAVRRFRRLDVQGQSGRQILRRLADHGSGRQGFVGTVVDAGHQEPAH